jgi:hypothetical protein
VNNTVSLSLAFRTYRYWLGVKPLPVLKTEMARTTLIFIDRHYQTSKVFSCIFYTNSWAKAKPLDLIALCVHPIPLTPFP